MNRDPQEAAAGTPCGSADMLGRLLGADEAHRLLRDSTDPEHLDWFGCLPHGLERALDVAVRRRTPRCFDEEFRFLVEPDHRLVPAAGPFISGWLGGFYSTLSGLDLQPETAADGSIVLRPVHEPDAVSESPAAALAALGGCLDLLEAEVRSSAGRYLIRRAREHCGSLDSSTPSEPDMRLR